MFAPTLAETIGRFIAAGDDFRRLAVDGNYTCPYRTMRDSWPDASDELRKTHRAFFDAGELMDRIGYVLAGKLKDDRAAEQLLEFRDACNNVNAVDAIRGWPKLRACLEKMLARQSEELRSGINPAGGMSPDGGGREQAKGTATMAPKLARRSNMIPRPTTPT